jgi:hypothetical protein
MSNRSAAGAAGGLIAGVAFDLVMRLMSAGSGGSMIAFAAGAVHASNPRVGWLVYPVYGVIIGAFFGWLLHDQPLDEGAAMLWGGLYGLGWWIITGLILIPVLRPSWPFSIAAVDRAREVAFPLLAGHAVYGVILGLAWSEITRRSAHRRPGATQIPHRRAA